MADSSPFFKGGVHDRVYAGIANYTAVMTDYNDYRNRCMQDIVQMYGQECNYEEICQKTDMMMNNDTFYKEMTQKAYEFSFAQLYCIDHHSDFRVLHFK